jgi:Na+/melibiose symporter-like transporter
LFYREDNFDDYSKEYMENKFKFEILNQEKISHYKQGNDMPGIPVSPYEDETINSNSNVAKLINNNSDNTKPSEILSATTIITYSLPSFSKMSCLVLLNIHALLFYESIGASLLYLSFFVALARAFEIVLKPLIAHFSDETKSSFGRRKPYMIIGCAFYSFFLILLFSPPSMRTDIAYISIWFGVCYVLFFIADTVTNVPYLALGPELSSDSKQRERLYIYFYLFQYIGVLFASAAPVLINRLFPECDCSFCDNNPLVTNLEECVKQCKIFCNLKNNETSLFSIACFIGIFFIASIILLCVKIKEKTNSFVKEPMHFIPSLYRLISNKPFKKLLVPWVIDIMISTIFATMLPFFLNFVINPQQYCIDNNIDLNNEQCSINIWLGYAISSFFICCIASMFLWHYLVNIFGKKKCWQIYSLMSVLTFSLFLMCEKGSMATLIFTAVACAIPAGGAYLNEVFVSDVIDYDEFFTGKRNEGLYTVFAAFIPKIVSIFAQSIPLTIMTILGFVGSSNGVANEQPKMVVQFIKFVNIYLLMCKIFSSL